MTKDYQQRVAEITGDPSITDIEMCSMLGSDVFIVYGIFSVTGPQTDSVLAQPHQEFSCFDVVAWTVMPIAHKIEFRDGTIINCRTITV